MRRHDLLAALLVACSVVACHREEGSSATPLIRDGMDDPSEWHLDGCVIEGGVLALRRVPSGGPAMAMRLLPPLPDSGSLVLSIRCRSVGADSALYVDLWGFEWDDPRQQMSLEARELTPEFAPSGTILPSGSSNRGIWLRVFTSSTSPIEVDDVDVAYIPRDLWKRVVALPEACCAMQGNPRPGEPVVGPAPADSG